MAGKTASYFTVPGQITTQPGNGNTVSITERKNLSLFCDNCRSVMSNEPGDDKTFFDSLGYRWRCYNPLHCDHAIVLHGVMHSCRVRTSDIHTNQLR